MPKFNIALTPKSKNNTIIQCAKNFSAIADQYLLGEKSLPHVTLYQFTYENDIERIWKKICQSFGHYCINLKFEKFSCVTFDNKIFWASLLPDNCDSLIKMHSLVANGINKPAKGSYDPHMTLINTKNRNYEDLINKFSKTYTPIQDTFFLSLGKSDDVGQFTELLYSCR